MLRCGQCSRDFKAKVITWVDILRMPQARKGLIQQEFNMVPCRYCGIWQMERPGLSAPGKRNKSGSLCRKNVSGERGDDD